MNQSEYLRNKQRRIPKIFGPAKLGDESTRIMVHRFRSSTVQAHSPSIQCCRPYANGVGYRQESSIDGVLAAAAGCEICATGPPRYKQSIADCVQCVVQTPYDQKAAALMGKQTCCAQPPYVPKPPSPQCCVPDGNINTFQAVNIPAGPVAPYLGQTCIAPVNTAGSRMPCCDNPIDMY
jgi:hypothetical protein